MKMALKFLKIIVFSYMIIFFKIGKDHFTKKSDYVDLPII